SDAVWNSYYDFVKKRGNIILGKRTYEIMRGENEFEKLGHPFTVVVSNSPENKDGAKITFVSYPKEAVEVLRQRGFDEVVVGGGSTLNAGFIKEGLIDEIYLDIEPVVFGKGIRLFAESDFESKLQLLETKKISDNSIQLHYKVLR
ncbi:MAG: dihydrofolate reductase family protein, partial [bacterium]|nr:dihydrofolate reductase family protein [bacterium]